MKTKEVQLFPSGELGVIWEDDHESVYSGQTLRKSCPCAMCVDNPVRGMGIHPSRFRLIRVHTVGNYALGMSWADGHDTGIYAFDYLRELCECARCAG